jgi:hypothetical protein
MTSARSRPALNRTSDIVRSLKASNLSGRFGASPDLSCLLPQRRLQKVRVVLGHVLRRQRAGERLVESL